MTAILKVSVLLVQHRGFRHQEALFDCIGNSCLQLMDHPGDIRCNAGNLPLYPVMLLPI